MKRILRLAPSPPVSLGSLISIVTLIGTLNGRHFIGIAVMPDELGYMKQAAHLADTFGFSVPGDLWYNSPAQIVPFLYAPFYAFLPTTTAVMGIHALNSAAIAFAAIPVYLVVYEVTKIHRAALFSAALTTITPWLVMSSSLMTEPISYAAFCSTFWGYFGQFRNRKMASNPCIPACSRSNLYPITADYLPHSSFLDDSYDSRRFH